MFIFKKFMRIPTKQNIKSAIKLKSLMLNWTLLYNLIIQEFEKYHENYDIHIIGYKIELVDKLYECNLRRDKRDIANELIKYNIDIRLEKDTPEDIVQDIANIKILKYKKPKKVGHVFASKYCHFHYPSRFPIFDQFARKGLSNLTGNPYRYNEYSKFKTDLDELISKLDFPVSYSDIDIYLWLFGQWKVYQQKGEAEYFSNEFRYLLKNHIDLFKKLE